jgi:8-oxo-dGTP diphosphatase
MVENGRVTDLGSAPVQSAVAIVTSALGVLIGRRQDRSPPWTFPGGKVEPGELPEDAAVRATHEENGYRVGLPG